MAPTRGRIPVQFVLGSLRESVARRSIRSTWQHARQKSVIGNLAQAVR